MTKSHPIQRNAVYRFSVLVICALLLSPAIATGPSFAQEKVQNSQDKYLVSHILLKTEKEAWAVYGKIKAGKFNFSDAAKNFSIGPSKATSGYLGEVYLPEMPPTFSRTVKGLQSNGISEPIKTIHGWHLIQRHSRPQSHTFDPNQKTRKSVVNTRGAAYSEYINLGKAGAYIIAQSYKDERRQECLGEPPTKDPKQLLEWLIAPLTAIPNIPLPAVLRGLMERYSKEFVEVPCSKLEPKREQIPIATALLSYSAHAARLCAAIVAEKIDDCNPKKVIAAMIDAAGEVLESR